MSRLSSKASFLNPNLNPPKEPNRNGASPPASRYELIVISIVPLLFPEFCGWGLWLEL